MTTINNQPRLFPLGGDGGLPPATVPPEKASGALRSKSTPIKQKSNAVLFAAYRDFQKDHVRTCPNCQRDYGIGHLFNRVVFCAKCQPLVKQRYVNDQVSKKVL